VVRDSLGIIVGVQGIFWDVTEKTIALEMLEQSELRYRQLLEANGDPKVRSEGKSPAISNES
jgi:hypothetical protein